MGWYFFSDRETFSCVTAEALCAGLPVVATRAGALPELVSAENGILVETGDVDALAQAMETIHGHYKSYDPAAISREATALYGYDAVSRAFDRLYQFGDRLDTVRAGE